MTVRDITKKYLDENGFDGLQGEAGDMGGWDFHIGPKPI